MFKKLSEALLGPKPALEDRMPEEVVIAYKRDDEEVAERDYEEEREYAESREDSREFEEAGREAERTREALEDFRASLDALNVKGGLTQESFQYAVFAAKTFENKLGLENLLDTSSVSFEGLEADARNTVSLEKIDHAIEHLKSVEKVAQEQLISANDRVAKNAASLENLEVVETVRDARSLESLKDKHQSLCLDLVGLESLRELLEKSNESGGLSFESLVLMNYAIEQLITASGIATPILTDSLESLDRGARHEVALENFDIAMEGVGDAIKKVSAKVREHLKKSLNKVKAFFGSVSAKEKVLVDKVAKFLESAKDKDWEIVDDEVPTSLSKKLAINGKAPVDLQGAMKTFSTTSDKYFGEIFPQTVTIFKENEVKVEKICKSDAHPEERIVELAKTLKSYNKQIKFFNSFNLPGKVPFNRMDSASVSFGNGLEETDIDEFNQLQKLNTGISVTWLPNVKSVDGSVKPIPHKDIVAAIEDLMAVMSKHKLEDIYKVQERTLDRDWEEFVFVEDHFPRRMNMFANIVEELRSLGEVLVDSYPVIVRESMIDTVNALMALAKATLTEKKASTESLEEVSMEASVKELKAGAKVKFSHGHGKIKKIFTSEFKIGHKHHKASKDDPRYLVAADKGGHLSIHKASALTLV